MFGFVIAHKVKNATLYVDGTHPVTFSSHKKGAKIHLTITDVFVYLSHQSKIDSKALSIPSEYRIIPFKSEVDYQDWLKNDQSNWFN